MSTEGNLIEVSPPSYPGKLNCGEGAYSPIGQWVTPGPTPSMDDLCQKFTGRPTELRIPTRSCSGGAETITTTSSTGQNPFHHKLHPGATALTNTASGPCIVVAGECLDGEAIKRRLMANRLPESCV